MGKLGWFMSDINRNVPTTWRWARGDCWQPWSLTAYISLTLTTALWTWIPYRSRWFAISIATPSTTPTLTTTAVTITATQQQQKQQRQQCRGFQSAKHPSSASHSESHKKYPAWKPWRVSWFQHWRTGGGCSRVLGWNLCSLVKS